MDRVTESQDPLLVKVGVRSWKAMRVPVGRRLARFAVLVRVWEMALRVRDGGGVGDLGVSGPSGSLSLLLELLKLVDGSVVLSRSDVISSCKFGVLEKTNLLERIAVGM